MDRRWSRREVLLAGAGLLLGSCATRSRRPSAPPAATAAPPSASVADPAVTIASPAYRYVVQPGDTLSSISRRSGLPVSRIIEVNGLPTNELAPGQELLLPRVAGLTDDPLAGATPTRYDDTAAGVYQIVPRSSWTGAPVRANHVAMGGVSRLTVHHTGEHPNMDGKSDIEVLRSIERAHREDRRWCTIGYHYIIGRDGRVYEGRPAAYQGAHTSGDNSHNLGISVIGDFQAHQPNRAQLASLRRLLDDLRARHGVSRSRVYGHRDLSPSICPGDHLYSWVKQYRAG